MIDLHIHSIHSDGSDTPAKIVELAERLNLSTIAITDHDSVNGTTEGKRESEQRGIRFIPGVELSAKHENKNIHLLGYFIDWKNEELNRILKSLRDARVERAGKIIQLLKDMGATISFEDVKKISGQASVGRVHIAKALLKKGLVRSLSEAFNVYLSCGKPAYVEKDVLELKEAVNLIKKCGGLAFIAHPGIEQLHDRMDDLVRLGISGIEIYHPNHSEGDIAFFKEYAKAKNLLCSGGSDFHGENSSSNKILGKPPIPNDYADKLFAAKPE